jgi:hypothetical protein
MKKIPFKTILSTKDEQEQIEKELTSESPDVDRMTELYKKVLVKRAFKGLLVGSAIGTATFVVLAKVTSKDENDDEKPNEE